MSGFRDLLDRFRPAGAPGAAGGAGVPVDRRATVETELEPVFAALADVLRDCADVRRSAQLDAARLAEEAARQAQTWVARARSDEQAERAAAAASLRQHAEADLAAIADGARRSADNVRRTAADRMPRLVTEVGGRVRAELAVLTERASREDR